MLRDWLRHLVDGVREVAKRYQADNGSLMAAAIAFFGLLSLIPILALAVSVLGFVLSDEGARRETLQSIRNLFPAQAGDLSRMVEGLVAGRRATGGLALLGVVWTASQLFLNLQKALNVVWDLSEQRGFFKARLVALGVMLLCGLMILLSTVASWFVAFVRRLDLSVFGMTPDSLPYVWDVAGYGIGLAASIGIFLVIYKMTPVEYVSWKPALAGAVFAGIAFEIAKQLFGWYLVNFGNYNAVYGSLGTLIILVTWIYYTATILMLGAEVTDVYAERRGQRAAEPQASRAPRSPRRPRPATSHPG